MKETVLVLLTLVWCYILIKINEYRVNQEWTSTSYGIKEYKGKAYWVEDLKDIILFKKIYNRFVPNLIHTRHPDDDIRIFIVKGKAGHLLRPSSLLHCRVKFMGCEEQTFKVVDVNRLNCNKIALSVVEYNEGE